jgi:hypothetical protein
MWIVLGLASAALIFILLQDGFETMVLPRRITRPYRYAVFFYRVTWSLWFRLARRLPAGKRRENLLSVYGPLSILSLFISWVSGLIVGFGLLHWALGTPLQPDAERSALGSYLYLSGSTFFTLGYGDVTASSSFGHFLTVVESGVGFGFMALIIGYLPVLYTAFSRREVTISMLDARAGSPPTAGQILLRLAQARHVEAASPFLAEWERWAAEVLESHLSFPVLSYYRSQHDNQSWLAALTAILDSCAFLLAGIKGIDTYQAQLTFAMARHAVVDLALVFSVPPLAPETDRLGPELLARLRGSLAEAGLKLRDGPAVDAHLAKLRATYEPFVNALARRFFFLLPPFVPEKPPVDNWQTSAWMRRVAGISQLPGVDDGDDHYD